MRKEAARARQPMRYDRRCAELTEQEIADKIGAGTPFTVRLKLRPCPEPFEDLVFGQTSYDVHAIEVRFAMSF